MRTDLLLLEWLRFQRSCPYVLLRRCPRRGFGQPDAIGVTKARHLIQLEFEPTLTTLHHTVSQIASSPIAHHVSLAMAGIAYPDGPRDLWFVVPAPSIVQARQIAPWWSGLLRMPLPEERQTLVIERHASHNNLSERLTTREMLDLGRLLANGALESESRLENLWRRWERSHEAGDWEI